MSLAAALATLALSWFCPGSLYPGGADLARVRTAQLPKSFSAGSAAVGDLDGDGREDLVVSAARRADSRDRALFLFKTGSDGELGAPEEYPLKLDVTAWALADVHPDPGVECVLFAARGAFVMRDGVPEAERFALLAEADFLWQLPDDEAAFHWGTAVLDLDGDGLVDLALPEPGGYALFAQSRDGSGATFASIGRLRIPHEGGPPGAYISAGDGRASWRGQRSDRQLGLSRSVSEGVDDDYSLPSLLLTVTERVPAPQLIDWDADGRLDLMAQTTSSLHVWTQDASGFTDERRRSFELPVEADRDRRLDASYSSHAVDLNRDRRADCVIFAGDSQKSEVRTQALIFVQGQGRGSSEQTADAPLFGPRGRPQDLLVFAGFVVRPDFVDVDGDGLTDLIISGVRPDLIDQLRSISSESIDADLFGYRNQGSSFSRRPDLAFKLNVPLEQFEPTARFFGDLTGDGISELLLRDDPERLRVLMVRGARGASGSRGVGGTRGGGEPALTVFERPLWELKIRDDAVIARQRLAGRELPDLLVLERTQVHHVRFVAPGDGRSR